MADAPSSTKARIVAAASRLFYAQGIRAVSVDAVAAGAKVTKRTLYYHFRSKDELVAAYLAARDQPNLALFQRWFAEAEGGLPRRVQAIFDRLAQTVAQPRWKGCGFLRTAAELANLPGHPAMRIGAQHKKRFEAWLTEQFQVGDLADAPLLARQVVLLLDGAFAVILLHRDPAYMTAAGAAARALLEAGTGRDPPGCSRT